MDCQNQSSLFHEKSQIKDTDPTLAWRSCGKTLNYLPPLAGMCKPLVIKATYHYLHSTLMILATV